MADEYVLELMRTGSRLKNVHPRGFLTVKRNGAVVETFHTLERAYNYTNLKVGSYEMIHSWKRTKTIVRCLRPTCRWITTVLIHAAFGNKATNLEGCVAPFMIGNDNEYLESTEAIERMFEVLGGFDDKTPKRVTLNVLNNYPGEHRTAAQWIAEREKAAIEKAKAARRALLPHG